MKTLTTGWAIIHPNGEVELDSFNSFDFTSERSCWPNSPQRQQELVDNFLRTYRPDCKAVRARVVPFDSSYGEEKPE